MTVGVARTKFLAKVASGVAKPDGLLVVEPAGELEFLHPLPIARLWGVGAETAEKLHAHGVTTVAQVAALDETVLVGMVGRALRAAAARARRTTAIRGGCGRACGEDRSARSARSARAASRSLSSIRRWSR